MKPPATATNPLLCDPDVRLMLRVKAGDEAAFTQLVTDYQDRVISILANILKNRDVAEDLAQEVFLRIYRARHGYEPTARFSTWLFRIANNLASNFRRDTGRRRETSLDVNDSGPLGPRPWEKLLADKSGLMPTRLSDKQEMCSVVQAALESLTEPQRMAAALDVSPSAVKSLLMRARETLRSKLEPYVQRGVLGSIQPKSRNVSLTPA